MKSISKKITALFSLAGLGLILVSFISPAGGEGFEIFLDNKVVMQRFGSQVKAVQDLRLDQAKPGSLLTIKYYHCGHLGKNRSITIRDQADRILKQWQFSDGSKSADAMECRVKDILALKKGEGNLKLYYSSSELPGGRQLASLVLGGPHTAKLATR